MSSLSAAKSSESKTILGHPEGLFILFFAELWERFSFYGLRALLVLYMTKKFLFTDEMAVGVYSAYLALNYATPIIGGIIADRILGMRHTAILGGVLIAIGNACMLLGKQDTFYLALSFIIMGTGLFKSNVSSLVGALYKQGDPRRDAGFTVFYMGINIGAFFSPLVVGFIGEKYGWEYGFTIASVGMLLGLFTVLKGQDKLNDNAKAKDTKFHNGTLAGVSRKHWVYLGAFLSVPAVYFLMLELNLKLTLPLLGETTLKDFVMNTLGLVVFFGVLSMALRGDRSERTSLLTILGLMVFQAIFFALYEQAGSSINLFTDRNIDRNLFGWFEVPTSMFQAVNPFCIVLFGPIFSMIWTGLARANKTMFAPMQFFFGILQLGLSFLVLAHSAKFADASGHVNAVWLLLAYLLSTTGELCLSPVGLSTVTKLAPQRIMSMMMGIWFLSISFANHAAGIIAKMMAIDTTDGKIDAVASLPIYCNVFEQVGYGALIACAALLVVRPLMNKAFIQLRNEHGHH